MQSDPTALRPVERALVANDRLEAARRSVLKGCEEISLAALEMDGADKETAGALRDCADTLGKIAGLLRMTGELLKQGRP